MAARYREIAKALEAQIRSGALTPGTRLPTEMELQAEHQVSRATAAHALNELATAGLAIRRRGAGSFVANLTPQVDLLTFAVPDVAAKGSVPGTHVVLHARATRAGDAAVEMPDTDADVGVVEMARLKRDVEGEPISIERHVLRMSAAPDLLDQELATLVSMDYLRQRDTPIGSIRVYLTPVNCSAADARLLEVAEGAAVFVRRRETRAIDGTCIETVETTVRPGAMQFFIEIPVDTQ